MRRQAVLLAAASLTCSSAKVFSVNDDLLAFPQYEIVFSDSYVLDTDAESSLDIAASFSSARAKATSVSASSTATESSTSAELSTLKHDSSDGSSRSSDSQPIDQPETYEYMVLDSSPYLCALPLSDAERKNSTELPRSKDEESKELARATDRGWELLRELEGNCLYFSSGWWSYSFCYNKEVKQFHALPAGRGGVPVYPPTEDESVPSFVLGHFAAQTSLPQKESQKQVSDSPSPSSSDISPSQKPTQNQLSIQTKNDMRYLVQQLSGGSTCDITGRPRKIEVQFHCHPQSADRIGWIKEVSTCAYLMVIYTPRLCNDVAFLPPKENDAQAVVCREVVRADEVEAFHSRKAAKARAILEGRAAESDNPNSIPSKKDPEARDRPVVGGIEVGAHKLVGSDGRRIDAPKSFAPADPHGEIVAKWHPSENGGRVQRMTNEQLRELDILPAHVDEMRTELQKLAPNRPWKVEVVEVPNGMRELRGVVDVDDDEGSGAAGDGYTGEAYLADQNFGYMGQGEVGAEGDGNGDGAETGAGNGNGNGNGEGGIGIGQTHRPERRRGGRGQKDQDRDREQDDRGDGSEETYRDEL